MIRMSVLLCTLTFIFLVQLEFLSHLAGAKSYKLTHTDSQKKKKNHRYVT